MPTVQDFLDILQRTTPENLAEDWDNIGLLIGDPGRTVHRILLALDPSWALIEQARVGRFDLIITHHPVIFRPLKALRTDTPIGRFIAGATRADIGVIACHTNLDAIAGGVSDTLAAALGLTAITPLIPSARGCPSTCGLGRIGSLPAAEIADDFLARLQRACAPPWLLEAGARPPRVTRVAVCGGSCSDFAETALHQGAEVFVTAEVKHSVARWAEDAGLWIIDAGHFATENGAMAAFAARLRNQVTDLGWDIDIETADQYPPLRLV